MLNVSVRRAGRLAVTLGVLSVGCARSVAGDLESGAAGTSSAGTGLPGSTGTSPGIVVGTGSVGDAGKCGRIASVGQPAHYGVTGLNSDSTTAFTDWLNTKSSATVDIYTTHPTLDADFFSKYDVLIIQWLTESNTGPYWTFEDSEVAALKTWVNGGGGLITLSGYDSNAEEVVPLNRLLSFTDISYNMDDVLTTCPASVNCYCWGNAVPLGPWDAGPIGKNVTDVGAFHGRSINAGSASVDCSDSTHVYAAHEAVGKGRVVAYTDEWVTYSSQWLGTSPNNNTTMYTDPNSSCYKQSAADVFQVPQFWYNVISWAAATQCTFTIEDPGIAL
jgi:hypothetical protein